MKIEKKWKYISYLCLAVFVWHTGVQWMSLLLPFLQWDTVPPMDMMDVGIIHAFGSLMNMLGAFLMGQIIDSYGIRCCFIIAAVLTGAYYLALSRAYAFSGFLMAQVLRVGFQFDNAAEMYVATLTSEGERTAALLKLGLPMGVSMLVGPYIAGKLTVYTTLRTSQMLNGLFVVAGVLPVVAYLMPETHDVPKSVSAKLQLNAYWPLLNNRLLMKSILFRVALVVPLIAYELLTRQFLMREYVHAPSDAMYLFCAIGCSVLFTNFFVLQKLQQNFHPRLVVQLAFGVLAVAYFALSIINSYNQLMVLMIVQVIAYSIAFAEISTQLTSCVDRIDMGKATGLGMSVQWLAQCFVPLTVGYFLQHWDYRPISYLATLITIGTTVAVAKYGEFINRRMVQLPLFQ